MPRDVLEELVEDLKDLGDATVLESKDLNPDWFDEKRKQYRAEPILESLASDAGDRVLGVTAGDLYTGTYNFVFGVGRIYSGPAVMSIAHLESPDLGKTRERLNLLRVRGVPNPCLGLGKRLGDPQFLPPPQLVEPSH